MSEQTVLTALCVVVAGGCLGAWIRSAWKRAESGPGQAAWLAEREACESYERELQDWKSSLDYSRPVRLNPEAARKVMHKLFPENPLYWPTPSPASPIVAANDDEAIRELLASLTTRIASVENVGRGRGSVEEGEA